MRAWRLLSLLVALAGCVQPQQVGLTPCDELAQPPRRITGEKPLRPPGIAPATINAALAEPACRAAIAAYPEEPRFHYQLALALNRLERPEAVMASFRRAAELGYAPAQADLGGNLLARQLGMPQAERTDVPEGLRWLRLAAAQGDRRAYYQLTRVYFQYTEKTRLIPEAERHPDEAMALLRRAVELGRDWAQYQMAEYAFTGTGLPQDPAEAVRLYRLSAAQGYPAAQIRLGTLLDSGAPGLAQDTS
jgi:TPR repeat protein